MIFARAFDQGDRTRKSPAIACDNFRAQLLNIHAVPDLIIAFHD